MSEITKQQPLEIFSIDDRIAGLVRRMRYMITGADKAPEPVVWNAAQLATIHHLDPFTGEVSCYEIAGRWIINVGIGAWRRAAQRQAKYTTKFQQLTPEETKQLRGADYDTNDVGYQCTLYRLDIARECKEIDIPYEPTIANGFWRVKAWYSKDKGWQPDTIPNTETAASTAQRRAEKKALKIAFNLDFPLDEAPNLQNGHTDAIERQVINEQRHRSLIVKAEPNREENGDIIFA